jgi:hypothetical protein
VTAASTTACGRTASNTVLESSLTKRVTSARANGKTAAKSDGSSEIILGIESLQHRLGTFYRQVKKNH